MDSRPRLTALLAAVVAVACGPSSAPGEADSPWVGTITTEGNVTTVINESGSVWGGAATLVEELSIGVEIGEDPYMLGNVSGIAVRNGQIYILDSAEPAVRVYDERGTHLRDIGRGGQGPGEFGTGFSGPVGIAFDDAGNLYVHARSKIEIFTADGELLDTWSLDRARSRERGVSLVVPRQGLVLLGERIRCGERIFSRCGIAVRTIEEGSLSDTAEPLPDLGYKASDVAVERSYAGGISWAFSTPPFVPERVWTIGPQGDVVVGRADRYEFERHYVDGTVSVVSRYWDPVPVRSEEADWYLRKERLGSSREGANYIGTYDLDDGLPDAKPAFREFVSTQDGGMWLVRAGPGERLAGCAEGTTDWPEMNRHPCWRDTAIVDAFDADGRYLGTVSLPAIFDSGPSPLQMSNLDPFIHGTQVLVAVEDEAGTIMVKRYRLVLPGE